MSVQGNLNPSICLNLRASFRAMQCRVMRSGSMPGSVLVIRPAINSSSGLDLYAITCTSISVLFSHALTVDLLMNMEFAHYATFSNHDYMFTWLVSWRGWGGSNGGRGSLPPLLLPIPCCVYWNARFSHVTSLVSRRQWRHQVFP